jgi:hypothetical protein
MISKDKVQDLVKLFYHPAFKTFYVNSTDGETLQNPLGVFVSLGITTSMRTLTNIKEFIESNKDYKAQLVEISSKKIGDQFINTVINVDNPQQYKLEELPKNIMTKEEVLEELEHMKNQMSPAAKLETITEYSHKVRKLQYLVDRLDESSGWDSHVIQRDGDDYRIFHLLVNYDKREGIEYRIGILVNENDIKSN